MPEIQEKRIFKRLPINEEGKLIKNEFGILSPQVLIVVKYPKSGSTLSLCDVPKVLIADSEKGTSYFKPSNSVNLIDDSLAGVFKETTKYGFIPQTIFDLVDELKYANKMNEYWKTHNAMENARDPKEKERLYKELLERINTMPFPITVIDTITSIVKLTNEAALFELNASIRDLSKKKSDIKKADEYGGVQHIRRTFASIKKFIEVNSSPFIQYHGHVATRKKVFEKTESEISAVDIALDGLISTTFTADAHAVSTFYRNSKGCFLDFQKKDESDLGSRALHLSNRVLKIADIASDEDLLKGVRPKTYWGEVYPEIEALNNK